MIQYRDHIIEYVGWGTFIFTHKEYTGPEDYCGQENSLEDCKASIDERIKDYDPLLGDTDYP